MRTMTMTKKQAGPKLLLYRGMINVNGQCSPSSSSSFFWSFYFLLPFMT